MSSNTEMNCKISKVVKLKPAVKKYLSISEAKPLLEPFDVPSKRVRSIKRQTERCRKAVYDDGPYYWSITLTFGIVASFELICKFVNSYLRKHNIKLFKVGYYNRENQWLQGYAFFEKHPMENSINEWHVHMLIKPNVRFNDFSIAENKEIFEKAAADVLYKKKRVFFEDRIDIRNARVGSKNKYLFKQINDTSLTQVKMIGKSGLSDSMRPIQTYIL